MPATSDRYIEYWVVVINKTHYSLNQDQAEELSRNIKNGNRGIVVFRDFSIPIPFIEEFYLESKKLNPKYQLEQGEEVVISEEQRLKNLDKIKKMREGFLKKHGRQTEG